MAGFEPTHFDHAWLVLIRPVTTPPPPRTTRPCSTSAPNSSPPKPFSRHRPPASFRAHRCDPYSASSEAAGQPSSPSQGTPAHAATLFPRPINPSNSRTSPIQSTTKPRAKPPRLLIPSKQNPGGSDYLRRVLNSGSRWKSIPRTGVKMHKKLEPDHGRFRWKNGHSCLFTDV